MSIAQCTLRYYLESDFFRFYPYFEFLWRQGHLDDETPISDFGRYAKKNIENGLQVTINDQEIQKYFSGLYNDDWLFSFVISKWMGLTERQITRVMDRRLSRGRSWDLLNDFILEKFIQLKEGDK